MKIFFNLFTLLLFVTTVNAQVSQGGFPVSTLDPTIDANTLKTIRLNVPNLDILKAEDNINDAIKGRLRIGTLINSGIQFDQEAEQTVLGDGRNLFRLAIYGKHAQALNFYLKNFEIPNGDELYIYSNDRNHVLGAYTYHNNAADGVFYLPHLVFLAFRCSSGLWMFWRCNQIDPL